MTTFLPVLMTFLLPQLAPPPVPGSGLDQNDFQVLHQYQNNRTQEECRVADSQSIPTVNNLFGPVAGVLSAQELQRAFIPANQLLVKTMYRLNQYKDMYPRPRPYRVDETLYPCIYRPSGNRAYPSAHAALGVVLSHFLANYFPYKKEIILKQGMQIGVNRLIGGVHHPSDVIAGQELGLKLAQ